MLAEMEYILNYNKQSSISNQALVGHRNIKLGSKLTTVH